MTDYIEIPAEQLSAEALRGLMEEFINREGTDYGFYEYSLEQKLAQIRQQLSLGSVVIAYDPASESCTLLAKQ